MAYVTWRERRGDTLLRILLALVIRVAWDLELLKLEVAAFSLTWKAKKKKENLCEKIKRNHINIAEISTNLFAVVHELCDVLGLSVDVRVHLVDLADSGLKALEKR